MELYTQAQLKQLLANGQAAAAVRTGQQEEDLTSRLVVHTLFGGDVADIRDRSR